MPEPSVAERCHFNPRTPMKEPDERPDGFDPEIFDEALRKISLEDLVRLQRDVIREIRAVALMGTGPPMYLPPEVRGRIYAYKKKHSLNRNELLSMAIIATKGRTEEVVELVNQFLKDPDSFEWPIEDPLLCVSVAFMRACATWLISKINREYDDEDEPADWWKTDFLIPSRASMTDDEFDTMLEAAYQEALNDPQADDDIDMTEIALQVHGDLFEAYYLNLDVRGNVTDLEIRRIEAMRQALSCYRLLHAREYCERAIKLLTRTKTSELSEEAIEDRARTLAEAHKDLMPLDEVESLVRTTLAGLGLPATFEEFEDYEGNRCRIKLNLDACMIASDSVFGKLQAALAAWENRA